jgi:hypothetical protein
LAMCVWVPLKLFVRPDPYEAEVLGRNALNLMSLGNQVAPLTLTLAAALAGYGAVLAATRRPGVALAAVGAALAAWWMLGDGRLHAWDRYFLRLLLLGCVPVLGLVAVLHASGRAPAWRLRLAPWAPAAGGALLVVTLVHAGETARFAAAWRGYVAAVAALAGSDSSDPGLGDAAFVSSARIDARFTPLAWHSTTPFLSILATPGHRPARLVVDPTTNYFWFPCADATRNAMAARVLPRDSRELVRRYTCLHH